MPEARLREFLPDLRELAVLFGVRGLACVAAWRSGFRALSDDDYARISIAQRFAQEPHFDPTGTSWLPAPFWTYGAAFRVFGTGMSVARTVAIVLSLAATVLVYVAARALGTSRFTAVIAAVLSCLIVPYSTLLGIAALPEVPCASLLLVAAATLAVSEPRPRIWGGVALIIACLSRYEAWPIAMAYAAFCAWDALRQRRTTYMIGSVLALSAPALWLVLGHLNHGDAWFFIGRVTAYRRALGGCDVPLWRRLIEYPWALILYAPALWPTLAFGWFTAPKPRQIGASNYGRCALALLSLLAFLMLGSVRDGVPTHHNARVLLPIWFFVCVLASHELTQRARDAAGRVKVAMVVAALATIPFSAGAGMIDEGFAERSLEFEAGNAARMETRRDLAIDTTDYGYLAVQAGFGTPIGTTVLDDHDPRHKKPASESPFISTESLERALREQHARYAVLTSAHAPLLASRCDEIWRNTGFVLYRCPALEPPAS